MKRLYTIVVLLTALFVVTACFTGCDRDDGPDPSDNSDGSGSGNGSAAVEGAMYVGYFGGELVRNSRGVWKFTRKLYVQDSDESSAQWATGNRYTGVVDKVDGKGNTLALYNLSSTYPAANRCFEKNINFRAISDVNQANYIWYLPAQNQLMAIWAAHNSFAATKKLASYYYCSATESHANDAWSVYFGSGYTYTSGYGKTYKHQFRCVREL